MATAMDEILSLAKRRGFVFPGSEIYGGLANSWDYGPLGHLLKQNIKAQWWKFFVQERADMVPLDTAIICKIFPIRSWNVKLVIIDSVKIICWKRVVLNQVMIRKCQFGLKICLALIAADNSRQVKILI